MIYPTSSFTSRAMHRCPPTSECEAHCDKWFYTTSEEDRQSWGIGIGDGICNDHRCKNTARLIMTNHESEEPKYDFIPHNPEVQSV